MVHDMKAHGELMWFKCPELKIKKSFAHKRHTDIGNFVVSGLPELPSMNFTSSVHNRGLLKHAVAVSPDPLLELKGRGLEQEVGGRQPGARSMCEQSVQPGQSRRLCVCVFVYVWSVFARVGRKALPYLRRVITS